MKLTAHHHWHTHLQGQEEHHKYEAREVTIDGCNGIDVGVMVTILLAMEDLPINKVARVEILE